MVEGEIIKFYREKQNMTQAQLGEGICTTTHVSKIERGKTAYSDEIIAMFSERLSIDIKKEIASLGEIDKLLQEWHSAIIMGRTEMIEQIKHDLASITLIQSTYFAAHYRLLQARYYIIHEKWKSAFTILEDIRKSHVNLTAYERNLLFHIYGIYYIGNRVNVKQEGNQKPLQYLKKVNMDEYGNREYYYHLATGYHLVGSRIMAYFYAEKALHYFQETNNYGRALNAESVMLLQMSQDASVDFNELTERYTNLIHNSDTLGLKDKKALFLNNLGFEYFNTGNFTLAKKYYYEALLLDDPNSTSYLLHLCNYVDACLEGNLSRKGILLKKIREGLSRAKKLNSMHFIVLFQLMKLKAEGNDIAYYKFIEEKALPHFSAINHVIYHKRYGKLLFHYYVETSQYMKATTVLADQL
ncbi:helix-turn-helix domain-containing protein [Virgibacillus soli]